MAQLGLNSAKAGGHLRKIGGQFRQMSVCRKTENREKYREIYEFWSQDHQILPRFRKVPGSAQGNSSDSWDFCGQALGSQWFTLALLFWRRHWPGNHQGSCFPLWNSTAAQLQIRKPFAVLAASEKRTAVSVRFRTFPFGREHRFTKPVTRSTV